MAENNFKKKKILEIAINQLRTNNAQIMLNALFAFDNFSKEEKAQFIQAVEEEMEKSSFVVNFSKAVIIKWLSEKNR